jgi:hypothetical protein
LVYITFSCNNNEYYLVHRSQFEENLRVKDPQVISELIQKAHDQVDVALHYKIPYPRPHYVDPGTVGGDNDFHRLSSRSNTSNTRVRKSQMLRQFQQRGQIRRLGGF